MPSIIDDSKSDFTSSDCSSLSSDAEHFEGPEKNLEIDFLVDSVHFPLGCRHLTRCELDQICAAAKCLILSQTSNEALDSYVLSESSCFVYPHKMILKTCGTTTLLKCLPLLQTLTRKYNLQLEWLSYSRKNFSLPNEQLEMHTSFQAEVAYLQQTLDTPAFGSAHVIGPVTSDHWLMYVYDACDKPMEDSRDRTLHVLMQDLAPSVAQLFFHQHDAPQMTALSGITALVDAPSSQLDAVAFQPCGYSMNAIDDDGSYQTIHITPESHCSYASWETNATPASYQKLLQLVISIFQPQRFTLTLFADRAALEDVTHDIFADKLVTVDTSAYKRTCANQTAFEGDYLCFVANFVLKK